MIIQISNYLFLGSLFLFTATLIYYAWVRKGPEFFLKGVVKSYVFWIAIAGIAASIFITL
ncbi:hypothetical protein SD71_20835 [Cohnella kolymensis]|uniref:Uncharacterized protein n=1 Tax=Cohnella kolymensis TaxID=1590652 RepID=A0ABR4ZZ95_9BACL|nr:hypothetical protein [Cohnella kolymensis]KIL34139.1 hypothetical protein SD71_20835 [Cohnella kolymensis]